MAGGFFSDPSCARADCGRPVLDAYLCRTCRDDLRTELERIIEYGQVDRNGKPLPGLAAELTTALLRNDRLGGDSAGWITYTPTAQLPYAQHASDAIEHLRTVLSTWIRDLWDTNGGETVLGDFRCVDTLPGMAGWLLLRPSWMALHPAAGELYIDIMEAVTRGWRIVYGPPARAYSGICGAPAEQGEWCQQPLYSAPEHDWVRCRSCGAEWVVAERRHWLLEHAANMPLTATRMAGLLTYAGVRVSASAIRGLAHRGEITVIDRDERQRARYRITDVRQALARNPLRTTPLVAAEQGER